MFCDLQGSTALSQQLDPEELRDVIRGYQEVCAGAVGRLDGHIAKYLGDGLLVYFGYPQAHEDDPQRAVRAGLAILQDMTPLNARLKSEKDLELTVRIGIHTGSVVAGEMGGGDTLEELAILGEMPNIAARIEGAALPNSVVVSDITANLIRGFFIYETLGPHELKGISEPVELFRVLEESGAQSRFDVAFASQLTPMVGREQEVGLLMDRWEQVEEGFGQVVLVTGEAGIGKSRLLEGINDRLDQRPHFQQYYRCSPYHQNSAFYPMIAFLERWLRFKQEDSPKERLSRIEEGLEDYGVQTSETVAMMAGLLSVPLDDRYPSLEFSPQVERQKTVQVALRLLTKAAVRQPVLVVWEDIHWADPSSLEFLELLIEQAATARILVMLTFRPEFVPLWGHRDHLTRISLTRLPRWLATDMMTRLTGGKALPEEVVNQIATKSDGVPLFVEELTQMVIESDLLREVEGHYELNGPLTALAIPMTLQDSLTSRLDNLSSGRETAQLAAVLGREFDFHLIQAVSSLDPDTLSQHLQHLVSNDFLYQSGVPPESSYIFRHALIQDAAYHFLLISRRQQSHQQVAEILEQRYADTGETRPELVAHHLGLAGSNLRAASYWLLAGERAQAAYAHKEALSHFELGLMARGIAVSGTQPVPDDETAALLVGLGSTQPVIEGRSKLLESVDILGRSFDYYVEVGQSDLAVSIALMPFPLAIGLRFGVASLIKRALELISPNSRDEGPLLAQYPRFVCSEDNDYETAQNAYTRAIEIAQRTNDIDLEIRALSNAAMVDIFQGKFWDSVEKVPVA